MSRTITIEDGVYTSTYTLPVNGQPNVVQIYNSAFTDLAHGLFDVKTKFEVQHYFISEGNAGFHKSVIVDPDDEWIFKDIDERFVIGSDFTLTSVGRFVILPDEAVPEANEGRLSVSSYDGDSGDTLQIVVKGSTDDWDGSINDTVFSVETNGNVTATKYKLDNNTATPFYFGAVSFSCFDDAIIDSDYSGTFSGDSGADATFLLDLTPFVRSGDIIESVTLIVDKVTSDNPEVVQIFTGEAVKKILTSGIVSSPISDTVAYTTSDGVFQLELTLNWTVLGGTSYLVKASMARAGTASACFYLLGAKALVKRNSL